MPLVPQGVDVLPISKHSESYKFVTTLVKLWDFLQECKTFVNDALNCFGKLQKLSVFRELFWVRANR